MAEPRQVIGTGKTGGTGTDDQDAMPGRLAGVRLPLLPPGDIANKALDSVNADGGVEASSVASAFAWMVTGPAVHRRKRVVVEYLRPCLPPAASPRMLKAATVEVRTGSRRLIEYILSPILKYKEEGLRER